MKKSLILIFLLAPTLLTAQNFQYKAKLQPISKTGFYHINLKPGISAYSQTQMEDLRIFDNDGKEVPYLIRKETNDQSETEFITYPISSSIEKNKQTITIENRQKLRVSRFQFEMKNADASRLVRISGSDDNQKWYVVRDSFYFESLADDSQVNIRKQLTFPATDYAFYKIEIVTGANESPLNIIKAGNYNTSVKEAIFQQVNGLSFTKLDSNKTTYLRLKCNPANRIDKLLFSITGPEMFRRTITLKRNIERPTTDSYSGSSSISKYKRDVVVDYKHFELSSDRATEINCSDIFGYSKVNEFTLEIENMDNEPLQIKEIKGYQLTSTATAKLEKDKSYFLYFGDSLLTRPSYDIIYFENNLPKDIQTIEALAIQPKAQKDKDEYNGTKDKYIVWIGLGLAAVVLFFLTMNMMRKMKNN